MRSRRSAISGRCITVDPYGSLEPGEPVRESRPPRPLWPEVGPLRVIARGSLKRCPRCGAKDIFSSKFRLRERCPRCELKFQKEEGGYLGAITINYGVTIGAWLVLMVVVLVATVPRVPVGPLLAASAFVVVAIPIAFYPTSKAIWAAIEYLVLRSDPDYRAPVARDPRAKGLE